MACFLVSAAEAVVTTVAAKVVEKREKEQPELEISFDGAKTESVARIPFSRKLKWLSRMLWGGSVLLMFEHIWHGEVIPFFPFLSAMADPEDAAAMFHEMATVGVAMAALVTLVWLCVVLVTALIEKRAVKEAKELAASKK